MDNDSSSVPQEGGSQNPANKKPSEKSARNSKKKLGPPNGKKGTKTKSLLTVSGLIAVVIEVAGLVLWQLSDIFHGFRCNLIHSISIACFIAGVAIFINKALEKARDIWILWITYVAICLVIAVVIFTNSSSPQPSVLTRDALPPNISGFIVSETNLVKETNVFIEPNVVIQTNRPVATEWMPPLLPDGCDIIHATWGESDVGNTINRGLNIMIGKTLNTDGQTIFDTIVKAYVKSNRLYVDAIIPGDFPFGPFKLSGNKIIGHLPGAWQLNYDDDAIELVNGLEVPVCQIIYERPEALKMYGAFGNQFQIEVLTPDGKLHGLPTENWYGHEGFNPASMGLRRIFKYPFWEYQGQRVQYNN